MIYPNTKERGIARTIVYPFKGGFRAVCLDFDLIEDAKTIEEANKEILSAMVSHVRTVCENNLSDDLLNRHADKKYWLMFEMAVFGLVIQIGY